MQLFHHCSVKILGQLLKVSTSFSFNVAMNVSASIFIVFPADASIMELSNYTDTSTESSNLTDSFTESSILTDTYIYTESNNLVSIITPTIGAMTLICGFLFATTCIYYHVMNRRKKALQKVKRVSEHMAVTSDT